MSSTGRTTDLSMKDEGVSQWKKRRGGKRMSYLLVLESGNVDEVVRLLGHLLRIANNTKSESREQRERQRERRECETH